MTEASALHEVFPDDLGPFPELHPARLDLVSQLGGGPALPLDGPLRWLELGCGAGLSLVPLALEFPAAAFVGVDPHREHLEKAEGLREALGVDNVSLVQAVLSELPGTLGTFDVIVLHRVYSHLRPRERATVLRSVEALLAPSGVVLLSFNTLPGWHLRGAVREAVVYHTRSITDPRVRVQQARAFVEFLASSVSPDERVWHRTVTEEHQRLQQLSDAEVAHDLLATVNDPQAYETVVGEVAQVGLTPVGDAAFVDRLEERLAPDMFTALSALARGETALQQAIDLCEGRAFRHVVLARARGAATTGRLASGVVRRRESGDVAPSGMGELLERLPASGADVPVCEVVQEPSDTGRLIGLMAHGLVDWWPAPRGIVSRVTDHPRVTAAALALAPERWGSLPSVWYRGVALSPVERMVAGWLDGATPRAVIVERLVAQVMDDVFRIRGADGEPLRDPELLRPILNDVVGEALQSLAAQGLLVG